MSKYDSPQKALAKLVVQASAIARPVEFGQAATQLIEDLSAIAIVEADQHGKTTTFFAILGALDVFLEGVTKAPLSSST